MRRTHSALRRFCAPTLLICALALAGCDSVEERTEEHFERGQSLLAEGKPQKALLEFRNALKLNKDYGPAHFEIGKLNEQKGQLQAAFGRYRRVIEIEPENVEARLKAGRFFLLAKEHDSAREQVDAVLAINPNSGSAHVLAAAISLVKGELAAAKASMERARDLQHDATEFAMVEVSYLDRSGDKAGAMARADAALAETPSNVQLHLIKLQMLQKRQDSKALGAHLSEMVEFFPETEDFRKLRIQWAVGENELEIAEADLRHLALANLDDQDLALRLVRLVRAQRGVDAARQEIQGLIDAADNGPAMRLILAQYELSTGDPEAGIAVLDGLIAEGGLPGNQARVIYAAHLLQKSDVPGAIEKVDAVLAEDPTNVDALAIRISWLLDQDRVEEAVQSVRLALNEAPNDVRLLSLSARSQELSGNVDLANDRYASVVRESNYEPGYVIAYTEFLLRMNRIEAVETVLSEAARRRTDQPEIIGRLGFIRVRLEDWDGANAAARLLEPLDAERAQQLTAAILIGQERFGEGATVLENLAGDAQRRSASMGALVQTYIRDGKTEEAIAFLEEILAESPDNVSALGMRGNLHQALREYAEAEEKYRKLLEINPQNGRAYSALVRLFGVMGRPDDARRLLEEGLAAAPDDLLLLTRKAQELELDGEVDGAIALYERIYERLPDSLLIVNNLASLLADHHADDPDAVDRAYKLAGRLREATLPQYHDTYGWTRHLKGEHQIALKRIASVLDSFPNNPWIHYHLGMIHAALKNVDEANVSLNKALELAGDQPFKPRETIEAALEALKET